MTYAYSSIPDPPLGTAADDVTAEPPDSPAFRLADGLLVAASMRRLAEVGELDILAMCGWHPHVNVLKPPDPDAATTYRPTDVVTSTEPVTFGRVWTPDAKTPDEIAEDVTDRRSDSILTRADTILRRIDLHRGTIANAGDFNNLQQANTHVDALADIVDEILVGVRQIVLYTIRRDLLTDDDVAGTLDP